MSGLVIFYSNRCIRDAICGFPKLDFIFLHSLISALLDGRDRHDKGLAFRIA